MKVVEFETEHLRELFLQEGNQALAMHVTEAHLADLKKKSPYAKSIISDTGRVLLCGGVVMYWENRGEAWAVIDQFSRRDFVGVFNRARKFLDECPVRRIEANIDVDFEAGHRWIKLLGFKLEASRLEKYRIDGGDSSLYVRIK